MARPRRSDLRQSPRRARLAFTSSATLRDNGSFAFYTPVTKGAKPPAVLGGELVAADLATEGGDSG